MIHIFSIAFSLGELAIPKTQTKEHLHYRDITYWRLLCLSRLLYLDLS